MSSKDYIYCYQGSALRVAGGTAVIGEVYMDPFSPVTIGNQIWSSKNLSIDDGQGGIYTQTVNYGQGDVVEYYYTWEAAMRVAATVQGWHLPTAAEWDALAETVGGSSTAGTKLKSTYGWTSGNGTDDYGFTALPAGLRYDGSFEESGSSANFWTATENGPGLANFRYLMSSRASMSSNNGLEDEYVLSVRLIKDAE